MEEIVNNIGSYIAVIAPSIVAILGIIASCISTIGKVKKATTDSVAELRSYKGLIARQLDETTTLKETVELLQSEIQKQTSSESLIRSEIARANKVIEETGKELESVKKELKTVRQQLTAALKKEN